MLAHLNLGMVDGCNKPAGFGWRSCSSDRNSHVDTNLFHIIINTRPPIGMLHNMSCSVTSQMTCIESIMMQRQTLLPQVMHVGHSSPLRHKPPTKVYPKVLCSSAKYGSSTYPSRMCCRNCPDTFTMPVTSASLSLSGSAATACKDGERVTGSVTLQQPLRYSHWKLKRDRNCCQCTHLLDSCTAGLVSKKVLGL